VDSDDASLDVLLLLPTPATPNGTAVPPDTGHTGHTGVAGTTTGTGGTADTAASATDTGATPTPEPPAGGCGCGGAPAPPLALLVPLLWLGGGRRPASRALPVDATGTRWS
jgi:hypothetical protein